MQSTGGRGPPAHRHNPWDRSVALEPKGTEVRGGGSIDEKERRSPAPKSEYKNRLLSRLKLKESIVVSRCRTSYPSCSVRFVRPRDRACLWNGKGKSGGAGGDGGEVHRDMFEVSGPRPVFIPLTLRGPSFFSFDPAGSLPSLLGAARCGCAA